VSGSSFFLYNLHNRIRAVNERDLSNTTLALATQLEQFLTTVESVQAGLLKDIAALGAVDTTDGDRLLSRHDVYLKLRDKAAGMPYVGSLTIINAKGRTDQYFSEISLEPGSGVTLLHQDGMVLTRFPTIDSAVGTAFRTH
jgi:hypothetical protein